MIPLAEAQARVLELFRELPSVPVPLSEALGAVLAQPVVATEPVPPFANTAMDGFAVRAVDTQRPPVTLRVVGTLAAGSPPEVSVGAGEAVRIMTGAPIPPGADAVVMVERTRPGPDGTVVVEAAAAPGDHVRPAGDDLALGETVFQAGTELGPAHLGVLASLGVGEVQVVRRPRVGVLATGDELVEAGAPLRPGLIRDANRPSLLALLSRNGFEAVDLGIVRDSEEELRTALVDAARRCDAVLTSGGVSVGDFDYTKAVLDELSGGTMQWLQVAIRPARPLAFGAIGATPVLGLPGNPVSSMVSFECFARPGLRKMAGHAELFRQEVPAIVDEALSRRPDGKLHLVRVVARPGPDGRLHVRSAGAQGSHQLAATARANALALVPDGDGVRAGGEVPVDLLDW